MKYYVIAGEASGDLHASNLIKEILKLDNQAHVRAWGGDLMQDAGATIVKHYRDLAFMGFIEVIKNLPVILSNLKFCKEDIEQFNPDVLILVDYPGFNLRIAKWAKEKRNKIVYYISPQVWAWKESRVHSIKKVVDKMLVILPFEKDFYNKWNYNVTYVGHPLVQVIEEYAASNPKKIHADKPIIALLPGSRQQEISKKLPIMLEVSKYFPEHQFIVAKAPSVGDEFYSAFLSSYPDIKSADNDTYGLLSQAIAALVTSGTATLETALFGVPEVVCYKGSSISYQIAKRLIRIKYISLVNLIMDKPVVEELIQDQLTTSNLVKALKRILKGGDKYQQILSDYNDLKRLLQENGNASAHAAKEIIDMIH
ncbi:MAG TPA: lipid-A-disaccharide synthase [Flavisolibacter sp.]|nr:lipid-A-disaccharide synthase [Flavisolibacter sp.]